MRAGRLSDDTVPECLSRADALTHSVCMFIAVGDGGEEEAEAARGRA